MNVVIKTIYNIDKWIRPYAYNHVPTLEKNQKKKKSINQLPKAKRKDLF